MLQLPTIPVGLVCVAEQLCTSTGFALSHQGHLMEDDSTVAPKIHNISSHHLLSFQTTSLLQDILYLITYVVYSENITYIKAWSSEKETQKNIVSSENKKHGKPTKSVCAVSVGQLHHLYY